MSTSTHGAHSKCREKDNCVGPGCRRKTGKTADKRLPVDKRRSTRRLFAKKEVGW